MQVNRVKDFVERVVWTAIQAGAAVAIIELSSDNVDWANVAKVAGIAALIAALKVVTAQQFGSTPSGDAIPGTVYDK